MTKPKMFLPKEQQAVILSCLLASDEHEVAQAEWDEVIRFAETDASFRNRFSKTDSKIGAMETVKRICISVTAKIACSDAIDSMQRELCVGGLAPACPSLT